MIYFTLRETFDLYIWFKILLSGSSYSHIICQKFFQHILERINIITNDCEKIIAAILTHDARSVRRNRVTNLNIDIFAQVSPPIVIKYHESMSRAYNIIIYNSFYDHILLQSYRDRSRRINFSSRYIITLYDRTIIVDYPTIRDIIYISYLLRDSRANILLDLLAQTQYNVIKLY